MIELTIQELVKKAKELHTQGKKWHFHMLTPDCMFNQRKDKHAFVLENTTDSGVFVTYSDRRYMKEGQELVKLIHGESILDKNRQDSGKEDRSMNVMLERARELNEKGIHWHHHMLFPDCIFNKHKGKWCIVFEDKEKNKIYECISEEEPLESLRKIEVLYYAQKE